MRAKHLQFMNFKKLESDVVNTLVMNHTCCCSVTKRVWPFVISWTAACQAFMSITNSRRWSEFTPIALVMPSGHLILWLPLILLPSIFPGIRDFSNESVVPIRWSQYWSFSFSISPSNEYSGLISLKIDPKLENQWNRMKTTKFTCSYNELIFVECLLSLC